MTAQGDPADVPSDFPKRKSVGAVSGAAPKVLLIRNADGRFEHPDQLEQERVGRWLYCEDLATQFAEAALRSKEGKRADWPCDEIIAQYLPRLRQKGWASDEECRWILRRAANLLGWDFPKSCEEEAAS